MRVIINSIFIIISVAHTVQAEEKILYEEKIGFCTIKAVANTRWKVVQMRIFSNGSEKDSCPIRKEETLRIVKETFSALTKSPDEITYESLYLGRIIYNEWLSRHLVDKSLEEINWSTESGRPKNGHKIAAVVEKILGDPIVN